MKTILHTLQNCPDLDGFSPKEMEELASISKMVDFKKGHDVFSVEHGDQYLFIVVEGLLSLRLHREHISKEFKSEDLFGEVVLFSSRGRMGAIRCLEASTLLSIDKMGILEENENVSTSTRFNFLQRMGEKNGGLFLSRKQKRFRRIIRRRSFRSSSIRPPPLIPKTGMRWSQRSLLL